MERYDLYVTPMGSLDVVCVPDSFDRSAKREHTHSHKLLLCSHDHDDHTQTEAIIITLTIIITMIIMKLSGK